MNYEEKYLKYKKKYLDLKESTDNLQIGGNPSIFYLDYNKKLNIDINMYDCALKQFILLTIILLLSDTNYIEDLKNKFIDNYYLTLNRFYKSPLFQTPFYLPEEDTFAQSAANFLYNQIINSDGYSESPKITLERIKNILMLNGDKIPLDIYLDRVVTEFIEFMNLYSNNYGGKPNMKDVFSYLTNLYENKLKIIHSLYKDTTYPKIPEENTPEEVALFIYNTLKKSKVYTETVFTNHQAILCGLLQRECLTRSSILSEEDIRLYLNIMSLRICSIIKLFRTKKNNLLNLKKSLLFYYIGLCLLYKISPESIDVEFDKKINTILKDSKLIPLQKLTTESNTSKQLKLKQTDIDSYNELLDKITRIEQTIRSKISLCDQDKSINENEIKYILLGINIT